MEAEIMHCLASLRAFSDQVEHIFATFHRGWDYQSRLEAVLKHFDHVEAAVSDNKPFPPVFATNRPGSVDTVASEVNRMLRAFAPSWRPPDVDLVTAYLNQGFALIADEVEQAPESDSSRRGAGGTTLSAN